MVPKPHSEQCASKSVLPAVMRVSAPFCASAKTGAAAAVDAPHPWRRERTVDSCHKQYKPRELALDIAGNVICCNELAIACYDLELERMRLRIVKEECLSQALSSRYATKGHALRYKGSAKLP